MVIWAKANWLSTAMREAAVEPAITKGRGAAKTSAAHPVKRRRSHRNTSMTSAYDTSSAISHPMCVSTTKNTLYAPGTNGKNSSPVATMASATFSSAA